MGDAAYPAEPAPGPLRTPDGRYLIVRGRLWRTTDPALAPAEREALVSELMAAHREKKSALASGDPGAVEAARERVDAAKRGLGERGPVWWTDGSPDLNRKLVQNTPYAEWYAEHEQATPPGR